MEEEEENGKGGGGTGGGGDHSVGRYMGETWARCLTASQELNKRIGTTIRLAGFKFWRFYIQT
jgi:hypothetical protein